MCTQINPLSTLSCSLPVFDDLAEVLVLYWSTPMHVHAFVCIAGGGSVPGTFITFCHRSSISILVSMCVLDGPVESEDTVRSQKQYCHGISQLFLPPWWHVG